MLGLIPVSIPNPILFYSNKLPLLTVSCSSQCVGFWECFYLFALPKERPLQHGYLMLLLPSVFWHEWIYRVGEAADRLLANYSEGWRCCSVCSIRAGTIHTMHLWHSTYGSATVLYRETQNIPSSRSDVPPPCASKPCCSLFCSWS